MIALPQVWLLSLLPWLWLSWPLLWPAEWVGYSVTSRLGYDMLLTCENRINTLWSSQSPSEKNPTVLRLPCCEGSQATRESPQTGGCGCYLEHDFPTPLVLTPAVCISLWRPWILYIGDGCSTVSYAIHEHDKVLDMSCHWIYIVCYAAKMIGNSNCNWTPMVWRLCRSREVKHIILFKYGLNGRVFLKPWLFGSKPHVLSIPHVPSKTCHCPCMPCIVLTWPLYPGLYLPRNSQLP